MPAVQARIEEFPGVVTAGRSLKEAKELVVDAFREYLLALGRDQPEVVAAEGAKREPLEISLSA